MVKIKLPNGDFKCFDDSVDGWILAGTISKSLQRSAVAMLVDGQLMDLDHTIADGAEVVIVTSNSPDGIEIIRHDAAHVLAQAVKELFPEAKLAIGPTIENGFYYDFETSAPFTEQDLVMIEERMRKIISRGDKIKRQVLHKAQALQHFQEIGESYKVEIINSLADGEEVSVYSQGDFTDLCRGPHSPSVANIKAFKLMKVAGAYWRGDSKNKMLQRIYGTAWATPEQLQQYLKQLAEAQLRDHRRIGKEMDLFHFQEEAPGAVFWHANGWIIFQQLVNFLRGVQQQFGYIEVNTPSVMDYALWETSGHAEKFGSNMFSASVGEEERRYAIKPMNCPGGVQIFKHGAVSYRDLPIKMAEFGKVHRYEPSGSLHGLLRVREFTQDDAHIFCTEEQINAECLQMCSLILSTYKAFGFTEVAVKFSDRPVLRIGDDGIWDKAEAALKSAVINAQLKYSIQPGEGAFYGPKLEFVLRDTIGRDWQMGTIQVDFNLPACFNISYTGNDGKKHQPVMLHRAIFGSLERFIGILLEHYAGKLPLWLAPVQLVIATITNGVDDYAHSLASELKSMGARILLDLESDKISYKIRKHLLSKVPMILVIGQQEKDNGTVSVRYLGDEKQEVIDFSAFKSILNEDIKPPVLGLWAGC